MAQFEWVPGRANRQTQQRSVISRLVHPDIEAGIQMR